MSITLTDFYKDYRKKYKNTEYHLESAEYKKIVNLITNEILEQVHQGKKVKLPLNLGELYIIKKIQKKRPIDWVNTKKYNKVIYHNNFHSEGYVYRFKWAKATARFKNKKMYEFRPMRKNSRYLTQLIKAGKLTIFRKT